LDEALAIRERVFVGEQGVPLAEEIDHHDRNDPRTRHALVRIGPDAVATGRFYGADEHTAQIGRLAVLPEWRGRGIGATLLDALVTEARRRGYARAHLWAQTQATGFYRRIGFEDDGEPLWDGGILHQPMTLDLRGQSG